MTGKSISTTKKRAVKKRAPTVPAAAPGQQTPEDSAMHALISQIESGKLAPEQLNIVLDAQERILDRQAKQAFAADMALCQAEMPTVIKTSENAQTGSNYEDLGKLNDTIKPCYTKHGFAVSFNSMAPANEDNIAMKATVSHRLGWTEEHTIELPLDIAGIAGKVNKTKMHATASSRSYARRYLLREIFNITTSEDVDNDGNQDGPGYVCISEAQQDSIIDLLTETGANTDSMLNWIGVSHVHEIPVSKYDLVIRTLKERKHA